MSGTSETIHHHPLLLDIHQGLSGIEDPEEPYRPQVVQQRCAAEFTGRVIRPWRKRLQVWLLGLEQPPADEMALGTELLTHLQPDREACRETLGKYHLRAANGGGQRALALLYVLLAERAGSLARPFGQYSFGSPLPDGRQLPEAVLEALRGEQALAASIPGFNLRNALLLEKLAQRGVKVTGEVTAHMLDDLRSVLTRVFYTEGLGPLAVAREIDGIFPETYARRAENIARTEVAVAQNQMTRETYMRNGVERKQWIAFIDDKTRDDHEEAHGQTVGIDQPFTVGGDSIMAPGEGSGEQVINCRCDMLPVFDDTYELPKQPWRGE